MRICIAAMKDMENARFHSFVNISRVSYTLTTILGMCIALPLGYVTRYFGSSCVLYGNPKFKSGNATMLIINKGTTVWGEKSQCYYTTFLPLIASIHAFIWILSLISMKKLITFKQDAPVYLLNILLNLILVVAQFTSSCIITSGFEEFCKNIEQGLGDINLHSSCRQSQDKYWSIFTKSNKPYQYNFYSFLLMTQVCSWLLTGAILFQCVFTIYTVYLIIYKDETLPSSDSKTLYVYTNETNELIMNEETGSYTITQTEKEQKDDGELFNL